MRVSSNRNDRGYCDPTKSGVMHNVSLDGKKLPYVVTADSDTGECIYVLTDWTGTPIFDHVNQDFVTKRVFGTVQISRLFLNKRGASDALPGRAMVTLCGMVLSPPPALPLFQMPVLGWHDGGEFVGEEATRYFIAPESMHSEAMGPDSPKPAAGTVFNIVVKPPKIDLEKYQRLVQEAFAKKRDQL